MAEDNGGKGYGKRPLWQWIVIYLIVGAIIYGLIYYVFLARKNTPVTGSPQNTQQNQPLGY